MSPDKKPTTPFERLLIEKEQLQEKVDKCIDYMLNNSHFKTLSQRNRDLLREQAKNQVAYLLDVNERIISWED